MAAASLGVATDRPGRSGASGHGSNLEGELNWQDPLPDGRLRAPPHDATGHSWHHSDTELFEMTKYGPTQFAEPGYESDMPAYAGVLTDAEIAAVLAFIKSTWPPEIRAHQAQISAQSARQ
jgi:hypothetical protein